MNQVLQVIDGMSLREQEMKALLDGIDSVVYVADPETFELLFVNETFRKTWGEDALGKKCYRILQNRAEPCPFCTNHLIFGEYLGKTYVWELQNEVTKEWLRCSDKAIRWVDGRMVRLQIASNITDEKRSLDSIAESEALNRALVQSIPMKLFLKDMDSNYILVNDKYASDFNLEPSDFEGKDDYAFYPEELAGKYRSDDAEVIQSGEFRDIEESYVDNGQEFWVHTIKAPVRNKDGNVVALLGMFSDINEHKWAENELLKSAREWQTTFDATNDVIWILDQDNLIIRSNTAGEKLFDLSFRELVGKKCWEITHRSDKPITGCPNLRARESLRRETMDLKLGDGWFQISVDPILSSEGNYMGAIQIIREITERRVMENELRESEERYRAISELISDFVYSYRVEKDGDVVNEWVAGALTSVTGYSREELTALGGWQHMIHPEDISIPLEQLNSLLSNSSMTVEYRIVTREGDMRWIRDYAKPAWSDEDQRVTRIEGAVKDITPLKQAQKERKVLQEQLNQSQKMEAVGRLAGGIAHDFNNLLTVVTGYCELLRDRLAGEKEALKDIEEISRAGRRATELTHQLLAFSRKQIIKPEILDLTDEISSIKNMLQRLIGEDIELSCELPTYPCYISIDRIQVEQILMNLAVNARDAMPTGGRLIIGIDQVDLDENYTSIHLGSCPGPHVMLTVSDTGIGMTGETLERVFEPFFTTKDPTKGTGLGLSTVYGAVKQSNGHIWIYSEPQKGTRVKIYFPRIPSDEIETLQKEKKRPESSGGSETILLVEDDDAVRSVVRAMLAGSGYTVLEAACPEDALAISDEYEGQIDLMLSDVIMPGMTGREFIRRFGKAHPDVRMLLMSGYTDNAIHHQGVLDPGIAFIEKPFSLNDLNRMLRELLNRE